MQSSQNFASQADPFADSLKVNSCACEKQIVYLRGSALYTNFDLILIEKLLKLVVI